MGFFSPNLKVMNDWRSSLTNAFGQLRRVKFAVEDTFEFKDFDPNLYFSGMTVTNLVVFAAKLLKLNNLVFFTVDATFTLAAPFSSTITFELPNVILSGPIARVQGGGCLTQNGLPYEAGIWFGNGETNTIYTIRTVGLYGAGGGNIRVNGFVEVE